MKGCLYCKWIFEDNPVDGLLTASGGEGPVVVEVLVHQHRQEVHHVHVAHLLAWQLKQKYFSSAT